MYRDTQQGQEPPPGLGDPLTYAITERDRDTIAMVAEALRQRRAVLAFQPIMSSHRNDRAVFWEGLIRILDRGGRRIPAAEFMGAVEAHELGREIDTLSLQLGIDALLRAPGLRLSINMSARSIGYPRWMAALDQGLALDPLLAERLILEITESSAMLMPDTVRVFMQALHLRGVSFALDHFASGLTSFRYLRDFDFDMLKFDGEFSRDIATTPDNQILIRAMIDIARRFQMFTVAVGVEAVDDAIWLADNGADCMQGNCFGVPTLTPWWLIGDEVGKAG